ncbi:hypothetical protein C8F04DRAFT_1187054 [Mycena alexandri]|uniref:Heme haloperoxidase family profile domain-containing protein n=1 Tax=Mycena alexandri TaxID=1745969 RepID=A0AAD6SLF2_9AGAR|nr:hypothetical protein C8F04DRAFT_1187054 [Mycena alexandri]
MSISLKPSPSAPRDYTFIPAGASDKRSPCPALNALANHGYLPRRGTQITFTHLLHAIKSVYNLSLPLAFLLTLVGFLTCAKFSLRLRAHTPLSSPSSLSQRAQQLCRGHRWRISLSWTLNLADLSARGWTKIAHDGSLVHASGAPSHAPDPALLSNFLAAAAAESSPREETGLTLNALAAIHATRAQHLNSFHEQIASGECALGWLVMRNPKTGVIDLETLKEWFGLERLPEGWWDMRPARPVGLVEARKTAGEVQRLAKDCRRCSASTAR